MHNIYKTTIIYSTSKLQIQGTRGKRLNIKQKISVDKHSVKWFASSEYCRYRPHKEYSWSKENTKIIAISIFNRTYLTILKIVLKRSQNISEVEFESSKSIHILYDLMVATFSKMW